MSPFLKTDKWLITKLTVMFCKYIIEIKNEWQLHGIIFEIWEKYISIFVERDSQKQRQRQRDIDTERKREREK